MMNEPRILIACYSRTGTTRRIVDLLAAQLGADVEPILEQGGPHRRAGTLGYLRSLVDLLHRQRAALEPLTCDLHDYDAVVVATPVWAHHASTPVLTWLEANRTQLHRVAWLCSLGAFGSEGAFAQMRDVSGRTPIATCAISADDLRRGVDYAELGGFARRIRERLAQIESWRLAA